MRESDFRKWMIQKRTMQERPMNDAVSRCSRIERCLCVNLDSEYARDKGKSLIEHLTYTAEDERLHRPAPVGLGIEPGTNIKNVVSSLRSAAKKYFSFIEDENCTAEAKRRDRQSRRSPLKGFFSKFS